MDVLAGYVNAGGSVIFALTLVVVGPATVKRLPDVHAVTDALRNAAAVL